MITYSHVRSGMIVTVLFTKKTFLCKMHTAFAIACIQFHTCQRCACFMKELETRCYMYALLTRLLETRDRVCAFHRMVYVSDNGPCLNVPFTEWWYVRD